MNTAAIHSAAHAGPIERAQALGAWQRIFPALLLIYSVMLFAPEVRISVGGLNLYSYRLAIIPLLGVIALRYLRGYVRFSLVAGLIVAISFWMMLSFAVHFGAGTGLVRAGALVPDFAGAH